MRYEIHSKDDLSSGAILTVCFPEEDLDRKALYTIQSDWPDFLLPFRYRSVDGMAECTYQLGNQIKLQYRYGDRSPKEYIRFWGQILKPLLECADWFLKPLSFVLEAQYLYTDRDGGVIRYLYVPSRKDCVEKDALQKMVAELSRQNSVTDPALENKVLRAIMQEFQPKSFLKMLEGEQRTARVPHIKREATPREVPPMDIPVQSDIAAEAAALGNPSPEVVRQGYGGEMDDIVIHFDGESQSKGKKKGHSIFGGKKEKKEPAKTSQKKAGFFGKKKEKPPKEIVLGAAAEESPKLPHKEQAFQPAYILPQPEVESEVTQLEGVGGRTHLRLIGDLSLPREIPVDISPGQTFTVGRFDVSVGHRQSSFEFDKKTKAVSRHHAAIERNPDGSYVIVDLVSSAGTFVDGQRLTPNVPYALSTGCRVSFGTGGADYIWEE